MTIIEPKFIYFGQTYNGKVPQGWGRMLVERGKEFWLEEGNYKDGKLEGWGRRICRDRVYTGHYK